MRFRLTRVVVVAAVLAVFAGAALARDFLHTTHGLSERPDNCPACQLDRSTVSESANLTIAPVLALVIVGSAVPARAVSPAPAPCARSTSPRGPPASV